MKLMNLVKITAELRLRKRIVVLFFAASGLIFYGTIPLYMAFLNTFGETISKVFFLISLLIIFGSIFIDASYRRKRKEIILSQDRKE